MKRRTVCLGAGFTFISTLSGCLGDNTARGDGNTNDGNTNDGDKFPDKVELDISATNDGSDLDTNVEIENPVITELRRSESITMEMSNKKDNPIQATDSFGLFPPEFVLEPSHENIAATLIFDREGEDPIETIPSGGAKSESYSFSLASSRLDRQYEANETIEYQTIDTTRNSNIRLKFYGKILVNNGVPINESNVVHG